VSQKLLLQETDEIYINVIKESQKKLRSQLNQLFIFTSTLNSKYNFIFNSDSFTIIIHSGALSTSSATKRYFILGSFVPINGVSVSGIASGLEVKSYGTVE